ncbi:MAG TPA: hypothetical protein RMH99_19045 [Sandaracinaceae bacterium LLY-WYZ-13_1]|nr:hypothetical protein [Sandaracinaceae bacterium LLY-WYZ-13_1]
MAARLALATAIIATLAAPGGAEAQDEDERLLVVVVDPGPTRINQDRLRRAIGESTERTVLRMTDDRARQAEGRLSIAFSRPDRWVLRYEAGGQVAWVSDRIRNPRALRGRLAELSGEVIARVDQTGRAARRRAWDDDVILALQNEIVDPFADDPPPDEDREPVTVLWSEVVDPFVDRTPRADVREVWTEVLDPWATEVRRR